MRTHDCDPNLTDSQVLDFCKTGYLPLEGVVPDDVNQRVVDFMDDHAPHIEPGDFANHEPNEILDEDWFIDGVICNPVAAGAVRSLLGPNFALPPIMSSHRVHMPARAYGWHRDGGSLSSHELNYLQVYYYPQDTTVEMGATAFLPGSHLYWPFGQGSSGRYGMFRGSMSSAAPAGSIFISAYSVWHRRTQSTASGIRNLLKYNYWRTSAPQRDWVREPDFDPATAVYGPGPDAGPAPRQSYLAAARMFFWLSGRLDDFQALGGQGWPKIGPADYRPFGYPGDPTDPRVHQQAV